MKSPDPGKMRRKRIDAFLSEQFMKVEGLVGGGAWVAQSVKRLPSVLVMVPGAWDRAPHRAPCSAGSLLLPLPLPLLVFPLSLSLSLSNR